MIGRIDGKLLEKIPPQVLIDVQGVGYELEVPMSTFYQLPAVGLNVVLVVHMLVREDAQLLYGFASPKERVLFRALLKVNGVGARVALAILSGMNSDEFALCIERSDVTSLIRVPGVGKKTAERLVVELSDKLGGLSANLPAVASSSALTGDLQNGSPAGPSDARSQAIEALVALGYKAAEATRMIDRVTSEADGESLTVEELIRAALRSITSKV